MRRFFVLQFAMVPMKILNLKIESFLQDDEKSGRRCAIRQTVTLIHARKINDLDASFVSAHPARDAAFLLSTRNQTSEKGMLSL